MRCGLSLLGLALAATFTLSAHAGHGRGGGDVGGDTHGMNPGAGNAGGSNDGNTGGSDHSSGHGDHGNSGGVSTHPPQGSCSADDNSVDLQGPEGQSGASHVAHTDFIKMDVATGTALDSPSSATMMYFWFGSTFDYVLNAHQLDAGTSWTLTYQPEPLPSTGVICLGSAIVNGGGQLHLAHSQELNSNLPPALDPAVDPSQQPPDALLALVLSADVDCGAGTMTNFVPDNYLWSKPRVRYIDTDLLPAAQP